MTEMKFVSVENDTFQIWESKKEFQQILSIDAQLTFSFQKKLHRL